ncbi:MAG: TonB-dependent receptor [Gemmatimonadota bacterium]
MVDHWFHHVRIVGCTVLMLALSIGSVHGQQDTQTIRGTIMTEEGTPIPLARVSVVGTARGAVTDRGGRFEVGPLSPGEYTLTIEHSGYRTHTENVSLVQGASAEVSVTLAVTPIPLPGIEVAILRPDLRPASELEHAEIREASPQDTGQLLRVLPGADAVRRGPLGLDPVVRGFRETQIGIYLDGTRVFPAGPARMDAALTHVDPSAIASLEVVKGPYALTWGPGNLTAIRAGTHELPPIGARRLGGTLGTGYESNVNATEMWANFAGRSGGVAYSVHGAWREGDDYESGDGSDIPADFRSAEGHAKVGFDIGPNSRLTLAGGYQDQGPIDYPGRLLTAKLFEALNLSALWETERADGAMKSFIAQVYVNDIDHEMDNRGKPTAEPNPNRMPSFALDIGVVTEAMTWGGRANTVLEAGSKYELEVGGDVTVADRDARREVRNRDTQVVLFEDIIWPDARITDTGLFARLGTEVNTPVWWSGTLRLDFVQADGEEVSEFFRENIGDDLNSDETNLSGAFTAGLGLDDNWSLSLGVGSAVRTADALERFSDRFPSARAQTAAEFVGDPALDPERSTQFDVWLEGTYPRVSVQVNGFGRWVDDYITIEPTDLPKRLPLSPNTVFRYINGEATFYGLEASLALAVARDWVVKATTDYLWGEDDTVNEPALGVTPFGGTLALRYEHPSELFYAEGMVRARDQQDRVADLRNESRTPGYAIFDLKGGVTVREGLAIGIGIDNLGDREYSNHLNSRNPFTGDPVPEPGRMAYVDVTYSF